MLVCDRAFLDFAYSFTHLIKRIAGGSLWKLSYRIILPYDAELYEMTKRGFIFYSLSFVVMGINIYGSSFFTALSNGLVSALISFLRTLLFQMVAVLVLPLLFGLDGIWISVVVAEGMALVVTVFFFVTKKKKYGY